MGRAFSLHEWDANLAMEGAEGKTRSWNILKVVEEIMTKMSQI